MPLTENEKSALASEFQLIGDMGEPEALIAVLREACSRKADDRRIPPTEASRWRLAANALREAERTVTAAQSPSQARFVDLEGDMKADIAPSQR